MRSERQCESYCSLEKKDPSYSQPGVIDIHGLSCANSDGRDEGIQHSHRFLKSGKL